MKMDKDIEIAECGYFIWLNAGCPDGKDHEHWLQAEAEFAGQSTSPPAMDPPSAAPEREIEAGAA
jgi:Protein of unknown function (DUF2934)